MDTKLRETTNSCVEVMNSKREVKGKTWPRGTNSRFPFDVNVIKKEATTGSGLFASLGSGLVRTLR